MKDDDTDGYAASLGEMKRKYKFVGKPEKNKLFGRPKRRLEDDIKVHIKELLCMWT
jgi:hypothetical protein